MRQACTDIQSGQSTRRPAAGFLLTPFCWAAESLAEFAARDPTLLADLFELDRERMHLIALALAHVQGQPTQDLCLLLTQGSLREVLVSVLGRHPTGMRRALQHMPCDVLAKESYRRLVELLEEPTSAKVLRHAKRIDDAFIKRLAEFPPPLRHFVLFAEQRWCGGLDGIADGLRFLAGRTATNFDDLVLSLARIKHPTLFIARLRSVAESLPLPDSTPPQQIALARRLDSIAEVRELARRWRNCLTGHIDSINSGNCAVYLWKGTPLAACLVRRHGRFGWFLDEVLGPQNSELDHRDLKPIWDAFAELGVYRCQIIEAVESLVHADLRFVRHMMRRHNRAREAER